VLTTAAPPLQKPRLLDFYERAVKSERERFAILKTSETGSQSALCRFSDNAMRPLIHENSVNWGIRALNKEQRFAFELLLDDTVPVVTLVGSAGTGKTLLSLAVGLEKVIESGKYSRFLIMRPVIPMGNDLGYLPGSKDEKLRPWMQPIYDNLELLFRKCSDGNQLVGEFIIQLPAANFRPQTIPFRKPFALLYQRRQMEIHNKHMMIFPNEMAHHREPRLRITVADK